MIQRIQSLWLLVASVCMGLCFAFPVASYTLDYTKSQQVVSQLDLVAKNGPDYSKALNEGEPVVTYYQGQSSVAMWPMMTMACVVAALSLLCIFLFKNRRMQVRMVAVVFLLNVVHVFLLFFWAVDAYGEKLQELFTGVELNVSWAAGAYLPLASLVFLFLAQRAIKKDEARVRAADRLRR